MRVLLSENALEKETISKTKRVLFFYGENSMEGRN